MQEPIDQDLARAALAEDLLGANEIGVRLLPIEFKHVCLSELIADLREEVEIPRKPKKKKSSKIKFTLTPEERKKRNRKQRSKR